MKEKEEIKGGKESYFGDWEVLFHFEVWLFI